MATAQGACASRRDTKLFAPGGGHHGNAAVRMRSSRLPWGLQEDRALVTMVTPQCACAPLRYAQPVITMVTPPRACAPLCCEEPLPRAVITMVTAERARAALVVRTRAAAATPRAPFARCTPGAVVLGGGAAQREARQERGNGTTTPGGPRAGGAGAVRAERDRPGAGRAWG